MIVKLAGTRLHYYITKQGSNTKIAQTVEATISHKSTITEPSHKNGLADPKMGDLNVICQPYLHPRKTQVYGNNVGPCPLDRPYISLDNKVENQFLLISLQEESKYWIQKTIVGQVHGSKFVFFSFLKNGDFLWNSVESLEFLIA